MKMRTKLNQTCQGRHSIARTIDYYRRFTSYKARESAIDFTSAVIVTPHRMVHMVGMVGLHIQVWRPLLLADDPYYST